MSPIKIGSRTISDIRRGSSPISRVMLGEKQLWPTGVDVSLSKHVWYTSSTEPSFPDRPSGINFGSSIVVGDRFYTAAGSGNFRAYDFLANEWVDLATQPANLNRAPFVERGGYIYGFIAGSIHRYSISGNEWTTINTSGPLWLAGGQILSDGRYHLIGNVSSTNTSIVVTGHRAYDFDADTWETLPNPPTFMPNTANVQLQGNLHMFQNWTGFSAVPGHYRYRVGIGWDQPAPTPVGRHRAVASVWNGKAVWGLGGTGVSTPLSPATVAIYDPDSNTWETLPTPAPTPRVTAESGVWRDLFFTLGGNGGSGATSIVEAVALEDMTFTRSS